MQHHELAETLPTLDCMHELEQLINRSLRRDWMLRIEYAVVDRNYVTWQLWGKTFFAVEQAEPILNAINACRVSHPNHAIRLYAKKMQPQVQMSYMIQRPMLKPEPHPEVDAQGDEVNSTSGRLVNPLEKLRPGGNYVWRYFAVLAMLFSSFLLIEGTTN